ncbi:MAG: carbamoyl phosphate synthase small subunit [Clostridia bacterium]|nr:carbamoyl phosphate synthase small subunit [Clostridia bacterium]
MKRYLVLENGTVFTGEAFGADRDVIAEIVFTTSMVGYVEALTDTSYRGQAICQTFPLGGNYGVCLEDAEDEGEGAAALIVRECAEIPSNFRSDLSLEDFLKQKGIPGLKGIDTRALTKILREQGTMNGAIVSDPASVDMEALKAYKIENVVADLSVKEPEVVNPDGQYKIALFDFGRKNSIVKDLVERDCQVHVLPCDTSAEAVLALSPDGIVLSAGPGNPEDNTAAVETLQTLADKKIPTMGISLGHQVLALANGFAIEKLHYGHRGASQPVRNLAAGHLHITSQNHSYTVKNESIDPAVATPYFVNVNDNTNEGLIYLDMPAFSVQFQPQYANGPTDTSYLYDQFMDFVKNK